MSTPPDRPPFDSDDGPAWDEAPPSAEPPGWGEFGAVPAGLPFDESVPPAAGPSPDGAAVADASATSRRATRNGGHDGGHGDRARNAYSGGTDFGSSFGEVSSIAQRLAGARMPPHSIEAEQAVLGGLLVTTSDGFDRISEVVAEGDFYQENHRLIFRAIVSLVSENLNPDVVTVVSWLETHGVLERANGLDYVGALVEVTPSAANVTAYAEIVRERSVLRQLISVANDIADAAFHSEGRSSKDLLDEAETRVFAIAEQTAKSGTGFQDIRSVLAGAIEKINYLFENDAEITGLATGFTDLDEQTSGLQKSDLVIVAGRPSMGKTTFAMNIAEHAAMTADGPVAVFSMEMPAEQLAMRLISSLGRVELSKIRSGRLSEQDWPRVTSAITMLNQKRSVYIDDTPALTPTDLRARSRRLAREHGLSLIVIDYLQLMQVANSRENRATEISEISRSLKALAKELQVPVVALSQLNRSLEQRPDKRPVMSDLRECVAGDTLVFMGDGSRVPIRDLVGCTPEVLSMDSGGCFLPALAEQVWSVGVKPVFEVTLASGRTIRATAEHRLRGLDTWMEVAEIAIGDRLAVPCKLPSPGDTRQHRLTPSCVASSSAAVGLDDDHPAENPDSELSWDKVVSVVPAGAEEVFDLTVPRHANWIANGVVSHNSGAIEQDADVIMFIYRDEVYNPEDEASHGKAEILIRKQRNGPIGTVHLSFLGKFTRFENYSPEIQMGDFS